MGARGLALATALVLVASCATRDASTRGTSPGARSRTTVASAPAPSGSPESIRLPDLPAQGVVVERGPGVDFVDLSGRVVARLAGFHLEDAWTVPGPIVLRRGSAFFILREGTRVVTPIADRHAALRASPQFEDGFGPDTDPGLPWPAHTALNGDPSTRTGFWAYALRSPDGSRLLAQWSGECEVPNAFFVDGRSVLTVDGYRRLAAASDSVALGWTRGGRAVVTIAGGPCSSPFRRPGVYLLDGPGDGELLVPGSHPARMWNPA